MKKATAKNALLDSLPVLTGYVFLGFGFGIIMQQNGFGMIWAAAMSLFIYAGSMQYVGVSLLTGGASLITAAMTTLLVNARHLFYGISMVDAYKGTGKKKPYLIFALTDETYSLVNSVASREQLPNGMDRVLYYFLVSLFDQCYWVAGTMLGSLAGSLIPMNFEGIDFALTALFVTIFVEQWLSNPNHIPAIVGVGATALCLLTFGTDVFLIPSMVLIAGTLILLSRKEKEHA